MRKSGYLVFISALLFLVTVFFVFAANDIQCFFLNDFSCPAGTIKLAGAKNDSSPPGFQNAHVQNYSMGTYNYSLCCNNTEPSITMGNGCNQITVIKLSSDDNAHIEIGSNSNYTVSACLNSSWQRVYCSYASGSCPGSYVPLFSMANSEGSNTSNAHLGDYSAYDEKVCCVLNNSAPAKPTLLYPADGNYTDFERIINFNWSNSSGTDPDGDAVDYTLNVSCGATCPGNCQTVVNVAGITTTNYTITTPLCVDMTYNWTVSACDTYDACNTSLTFDFNISSLTDFILLINSTSFGSMNPGQNDDTTDLSPTPLVGYNNGNVKINVTVNATQLFSSVASNTYYFMFEAADNESGSLNMGCSQTTFANMSTSQKNMFCDLSYDDSADAGNIHFNITAPNDEPAGSKSSSVQFTAFKSE